MRKEAYIILTHYYTPSKEQNKWDANELIEFVGNIKNKHYEKATMIVDFINKKIIKSRVSNATYESFEDHVYEKYPEKIKQFKEEIKAIYGIDLDPPKEQQTEEKTEIEQ